MDLELLELSAKAARLDLTVVGDRLYFTRDGYLIEQWNPLTDDGDAARLEAILGLNVSWGHSRVQVGRDIRFSPAEYYGDHRGDRQAARRRAGVRAAAAIGKGME